MYQIVILPMWSARSTCMIVLDTRRFHPALLVLPPCVVKEGIVHPLCRALWFWHTVHTSNDGFTVST